MQAKSPYRDAEHEAWCKESFVDGYTPSSSVLEDYNHLKPDVMRDVDRLTTLRGATDSLEDRLITLESLQEWASDDPENPRTLPEQIRQMCGYYEYPYRGGHVV